MEFDKEFRLPFRQTAPLTNLDNPINLMDFGWWGGATLASLRSRLSITGQSSSDNNCPVLPDVYSQLVNYEYCKISAIELDIRVTDYQENSAGGGIARSAPHFTRDPNAQLLCRLITTSTDYTDLVGAATPVADYEDRMKVMPNTKKGTSFHYRLPTSWKMHRGIAGRRMLTFAGRTASPAIDINISRLNFNVSASLLSPGGPLGNGTATNTLTFNIGNISAGTSSALISNAVSNPFYYGLGQSVNALNPQDDIINIQSKFGISNTNVFTPFASVVADNSYPRCIAITPLLNDSATASDRNWSVQVITTLVVKARGYIPTAATSAVSILQQETALLKPLKRAYVNSESESDTEDDRKLRHCLNLYRLEQAAKAGNQ